MIERILKAGVHIILRSEEYTEHELDTISRFLNQIKIGVLQLDWAISEQGRRDDMNVWFESYQGKND